MARHAVLVSISQGTEVTMGTEVTIVTEYIPFRYLTRYNDGVAFATTARLNSLFCEALLDYRHLATGDRPDLQAERCKRSNPASEAFQR